MMTIKDMFARFEKEMAAKDAALAHEIDRVNERRKATVEDIFSRMNALIREWDEAEKLHMDAINEIKKKLLQRSEDQLLIEDQKGN